MLKAGAHIENSDFFADSYYEVFRVWDWRREDREGRCHGASSQVRWCKSRKHHSQKRAMPLFLLAIKWMWLKKKNQQSGPPHLNCAWLCSTTVLLPHSPCKKYSSTFCWATNYVLFRCRCTSLLSWMYEQEWRGSIEKSKRMPQKSFVVQVCIIAGNTWQYHACSFALQLFSTFINEQELDFGRNYAGSENCWVIVVQCKNSDTLVYRTSFLSVFLCCLSIFLLSYSSLQLALKLTFTSIWSLGIECPAHCTSQCKQKAYKVKKIHLLLAVSSGLKVSARWVRLYACCCCCWSCMLFRKSFNCME